ncbi:preprotein translocase subunit SecE [Chloroflexi bacterium TSY]|nr:preprotein translocase subunit SecE [Chloroflexi bacterium TSY]
MSRSTAAKAKTDNAIVRYIRDTRAEISKVTWPTREEGIRLTIIVVIVTAIAGAVLFGIDNLFGFLISVLIQAG